MRYPVSCFFFIVKNICFSSQINGAAQERCTKDPQDQTGSKRKWQMQRWRKKNHQSVFGAHHS